MPAIATDARHRFVNDSANETARLWLGRFVDLCLVSILVLAPWFMGGRGPVGHLMFVLLPSAAAVAWAVRQSLLSEAPWRWSGAELLLLSGAALLVFQLIPLPQSFLCSLSPALKNLLPLWIGESEGVHLGDWSTLSLTPESTRGCLTVYLSYAVLFLLLIQRLETIEDIAMLLRVIACAAAVMAIIGLFQFFVGSNRFLGIYEHPSRSASQVVRGTFQNENHFAHFLSLGLGALIWWLLPHGSKKHSREVQTKHIHWQRSFVVQSTESFRQPLLLISLLLVALAGLLTFSRGGVLTMAIALLACLAIMYWKSLIDRRTAIVLSVVAATNLLALMVFGMKSLSTQLATIVPSTSLATMFDGRADLWDALKDGISHFYLTGSGAGSQRDVYPIYMEEKYSVEFTHGESGYLPLLLETGVCGFALMITGISATFYWCLRTLVLPMAKNDSAERKRSSNAMLIGCCCAIVPSFVASVVHSVADFVWYIPACMVMTVSQVACACRLYQLARDSQKPALSATAADKRCGCSLLSRNVWAVVTAVLLIASGSMTWNRIGPALAAPHWDHYLKYSLIHESATKESPSQQSERLNAMEYALSQVLRHDPRDARAHLRLAAIYLKQFELAQLSSENSLDLAQIRDAALASSFPSKADQDAWLQVVLGDRRSLLDLAQSHGRQAVTLSPLQGLGYLQLADLTFLESPRAERKQSYIQQATLVRPYSGRVLFVRGKEAALAGDLKSAFESWKKAFQQDPEIRQLLIESLSDQLPAADFVNCFEPDLASLVQLYDRYRASNRIDDAKWIAPRFIAALQSTAETKPSHEAASCWREAQLAYSWLGESEKALSCQLRAVELSPLDFDGRRVLAQLLVQQDRHEEAITHLEWCLRRQPDREDLRNELANAKVALRQSIAPVAAKDVGRRRG